jgi:hypothetical protein
MIPPTNSVSPAAMSILATRMKSPEETQ